MNDIIAVAIDAPEETTDRPVMEVKFHAKDSAAFDVKYAGISPAMFAAIASWCNYMSTKGYAERDYAETMQAQAKSKIIPATVMPGGRH